MDYCAQEMARRIRYQAKMQDTSLREMYLSLGLPHKTVAYIADGEKISYQVILKIADYLDCSIDYLLGRTDNPICHKERSRNE